MAASHLALSVWPYCERGDGREGVCGREKRRLLESASQKQEFQNSLWKGSNVVEGLERKKRSRRGGWKGVVASVSGP